MQYIDICVRTSLLWRGNEDESHCVLERSFKGHIFLRDPSVSLCAAIDQLVFGSQCVQPKYRAWLHIASRRGLWILFLVIAYVSVDVLVYFRGTIATPGWPELVTKEGDRLGIERKIDQVYPIQTLGIQVPSQKVPGPSKPT